MNSVDLLSKVSFFQGVPAWALREFADASATKSFARNTYLLHQHDEASKVYFLLSGTVQFYIRVGEVHDLLVGTMMKFGEILGWSSFRPPYRYTSSVRCETPCQALVIPRFKLLDVMSRDAQLGTLLLRRTAKSVATRLEQARDLLVESNVSDIKRTEG